MLHLNSIYDENTSKNSSLINDNYEGFTEYKNYFERSKPNNVEIAIFVDRLIAIFEKLLSQLEFAVCTTYYTLKKVLSIQSRLQVTLKTFLRPLYHYFCLIREYWTS